MSKYLIDTNIAIFYLKGLLGLKEKFKQVNQKEIYISEITLAELKFGFEKGIKTEKRKVVSEDFLSEIQILPIIESIDFYAKEKARLQKQGTPVDDFDLLIATTAVSHNLIVVTNNTKHFKNVNQIVLEDWTLPTKI